jgi:hypothetical protein
MPVWLRKMVFGLSQHNKCNSLPWLLVSRKQRCAPARTIWLLIAVSDWPIIMIRPGGLLLVVSPTQFAVPVSVLSGKYSWRNVKKNVPVWLRKMEGHILRTLGDDALGPYYVRTLWEMMLLVLIMWEPFGRWCSWSLLCEYPLGDDALGPYYVRTLGRWLMLLVLYPSSKLSKKHGIK